MADGPQSKSEGSAVEMVDLGGGALPAAGSSLSARATSKRTQADYAPSSSCCSQALQVVQVVMLLLVFISGAGQMSWAIAMLTERLGTKFCVDGSLDHSCDASGVLSATQTYAKPACFMLSDAQVSAGVSDVRVKLGVQVWQDCPENPAAIATAQAASSECSAASATGGHFGKICEDWANGGFDKSESVAKPAETAGWFTVSRESERCYSFTGGGYPLPNQVVHIFAGLMGLLTGVISVVIIVYQVVSELPCTKKRAAQFDEEEGDGGGGEDEDHVDGSASRLPLIQLVLFIVGFLLCVAALFMDAVFYVQSAMWFSEHFDSALTATNGSINWVHDATHQFTDDSVRQSLVASIFDAMTAQESVSPPCAGIASATPKSSTVSLTATRTGLWSNNPEGGGATDHTAEMESMFLVVVFNMLMFLIVSVRSALQLVLVEKLRHLRAARCAATNATFALDCDNWPVQCPACSQVYGIRVLRKVSVLLCTVTFHANLAHSLTRSP